MRRNIFLSAFFALLSFLAFPAAGFTQDLAGFTEILRNGTVEQKRDVLARIRNIRTSEASSIAVPALRDSSEIVRATAASSVVFLDRDAAAQALVPLLSDKSPFVRREAAYALGMVGAPAAAAPLVRLLQRDKDLEVRSAAAVALGGIGDPLAVPPLLAVLRQKPDEEREFLRRSAARSVGQIAQFVRTGRRDVVTPKNFLPEKFKDGSGQPIDTTAFNEAVIVLSNVLQNRSEADDTRREAAFALGAIGSTSSAALLRSFLGGSDPYLAEISKEALIKIGLAPQN